ncbi:NAD(P)-binding domain-containing protein [Arthrobacter sp. CAN_C5]|uniref:NAD(P)-binding domain-containing protein n=1 Tax=Arthrobacter sp. CAN_C5 TaxID=2760706 RepID=UPI001AE95510|nr:NAD(P)-binding domain-containing protein [Arthrobacter sp. CAN_C5]MBP2217032.1 thioredoxin reductase [Arthrobacter sp. CAN_C5]
MSIEATSPTAPGTAFGAKRTTGETSPSTLPVAVIGAGPTGLAAAANLLERGLTPIVFEQGESVGAAIRQWAHIRLFSPWQYNIDPVSRRLLEPTGWTEPSQDTLPYGGELVASYLEPLAAVPAIAKALHFNSTVTAVTRSGMDKTRTKNRDTQPFLVRVTGPGGTVDHLVRAVIDASGTWSQPNPLGQAGLLAPGEDAVSGFITTALPDVVGTERERFAGKTVMVVGAGHSAVNTLINLGVVAQTGPGTRILWAVRSGGSTQRLYGGGDLDGLPARGALGSRLRTLVADGVVELVTNFTITSLARNESRLSVGASTPDGARTIEVDVLVPATGFRPNLDMLRELRLELDPAVEAPRALGPLIDPEFHSCGTVPAHGADILAHPEKDFYLVGMKSYGRAPTFLLATGYEQVRSVTAAIAGDTEAASRLQLQLPETGACRTDLGSSGDTPPAAVADSGAAGGSGCGPATAGPANGAAAAGCCSAPQLITVGFPTGTAHGRSGDPDY